MSHRAANTISHGYERVYADLRQRILSLELKPGESLSEGRLAEDHGMSRTPIREALIRLSMDGLVISIARHKTIVTPIRFADVMDAQFAREGLEVAVVHDIASDPGPSLLTDLDSNLERQERAVRTSNLTRLYELDEQMHRLMAFSCRRPGIWEFIQEHKVHVDRIRKLTLFPEHAPNILAQHRAIFDGIKARDPARATEAMRHHLRFIVENYGYLARRHPEFIQPPHAKERSGKAAKKPKAGRPRKLTASDQEAIIQHIILDGMTGAQVAAKFAVSEATISRVRRAGSR